MSTLVPARYSEGFLFRRFDIPKVFYSKPGPAARALAMQAAGRPVHGHLSERSAAERAL